MLLIGAAVWFAAVVLIWPISNWLRARTNEANARAEEARARAVAYRTEVPS